MNAFSTSDLSQILVLSTQGVSQSESIINAKNSLSQLGQVIIIDILTNYNSGANIWECSIIYANSNATITFY